ncbi:MAG: TIGR03089 family protein [Intrasporangium sp.]|uniref:TIGR03089 family protein n=1 Tax=Intrasporangium sp. TaxID=1925024 RepID=UPI0026491914|nr:TIGR03089 family protein [Intrasporangium sp.]MDN5794482.1 TIGR03089 family protein [Intrasporangium sp.]
MLSPSEILTRMQASDPGRPRLTWYDDVPGPTQGERIELSAHVLANWVAKAANLLQDDAGAEPGTRVGLDLPTHWRAVYWALATWAVGATAVTGPDSRNADVLVTHDPEHAADHHADAVLVCLPALARRHPDASLAPGAVDEARDLATHGDRFSPLADPEPGDLALDGQQERSYAELVTSHDDWPGTPRAAVSGVLPDALLDILAVWALDGSVLLSRGSPGDPEGRRRTEAVTLDLQEE